MTDAEYRKSRKAVVVPAFFKRKIFLVLMLLITSGIMAAVSTYAWFILSTAPEVRGVSTIVGANGSLEMALLNEQTGLDPALIRADVGDSISIVGAVEGNVTWGNLVDLSDTTYGLNTLVLYPSILHTTDTGAIDTGAPLSIPHNGVDGRITRVDSSTASAKYDGTGFSTVGANFGVRAIGSMGGGGSNRGGYLSSARNAFTANLSSAASTAKNALIANGTILMGVAADGADGTYFYEDVEAVRSLVSGIKNALSITQDAYKKAILASAAASATLSDSDFEDVRAGLAVATGNELSRYASYFPSGITAADLNKISDDIAQADVALNLAGNLLYVNYGTDEEEPAPADTVYTYSQLSPILEKLVNTSALSSSSLSGRTLTLNHSVGAGLMQEVAEYVGSYEVEIGIFTLKVETEQQSGSGILSAVDLSGLTAPESSGAAAVSSSTMTNFYGYAVDLAFRTNVAADLQLQTTAIDRIYTDGAGATRGQGSNMTLTYETAMTAAQISSLFSAVRVVFFDPDSGFIYATGRLGSPTTGSGTASADLYLTNELGELTEGNVAITNLETAVPKKLSVMVYFDGTMLNNVSVVNAENSGTMLLNLQFSSSADLKPMVDSELISAVE